MSIENSLLFYRGVVALVQVCPVTANDATSKLPPGSMVTRDQPSQAEIAHGHPNQKYQQQACNPAQPNTGQVLGLGLNSSKETGQAVGLTRKIT